MSVTAMKAKNAVESLRDIVQDLLVPELKSLKVSIDSLRSETNISMDALRNEMRLRDEKQTQAFHHLSEKLDRAIDIRERLAPLEARVPRA
jgi:hypothetical protein